MILAQNSRREQPVPEKVIRDLAARCEPPTWAEAHGVILVEHFEPGGGAQGPA